MTKRSILIAVLLGGLIALGIAGAADGLQAVPSLSSRVTDLTATLSNAEKTSLDAKLAALEQRKGAQVAVLIVPTTAPEAI
jgi:uncharacterized protein